MAAHSSILAWRISGTEEPDRLWSIGSQRLGHNWNDLALMTSIDTVQSYHHIKHKHGLPRWWRCKEFACQCSRCGFHPWVGKIPWSRKWPPAPVFLPGKFHGPKSLAGYISWVCKELDMTEWLSIHTHTPTHTHTHKLWRERGQTRDLWNSPGKNTGVGSHSLLQEIFETQGLNPHLLTVARFFTVWVTMETQKRDRCLQISGFQSMALGPVALTPLGNFIELQYLVHTDTYWIGNSRMDLVICSLTVPPNKTNWEPVVQVTSSQ